MVQPKEVVDVSMFWDEWSRCVSSGYQRDQYYRLGKFDNCAKQWNDFKTAGRAKVAKTEEEAKGMLAKTHLYQRKNVSPTAGVIWELKETPGWD
ncbi:expressed unknown protein [Seminavis robusta]|uniref:Uncharacterized protein n=1 Tax=Seminavis robusta TaxID=568900 RepID=A0A9N8HVV7_9STRA|nr:expressed unknown protein [Seminavis robusta]|eukprot:Sro1874_g303010.1 n/a (94) ;mRNA; f:18947-19228